MKRIYVALVVIAATIGLSGCTGATPSEPARAAQSAPSPTQGEVVSYEGLADIRFGDARAELAHRHGMTQGPGDCAPRLPDRPDASPVFDDGELVLLWADPPLHTPEGVMVGDPVAEVHSAYPDAEALTAPSGTYQHDGLLATQQDRAYLFLHDGEQVQKVVAGYAEHARLLFHEGFGTC